MLRLVEMLLVLRSSRESDFLPDYFMRNQSHQNLFRDNSCIIYQVPPFHSEPWNIENIGVIGQVLNYVCWCQHYLWPSILK